MIIKTPSRLHMCLIDMSGEYGRTDGGIGLTINQPNLILKGIESNSNKITVDFKNDVGIDAKPECQSKVIETAEKIRKFYDIETGFDFEVFQTYPAHSGLGSGTQIALATAKIITETMDIHENSFKLSSIVGRGGTSGIGTFC